MSAFTEPYTTPLRAAWIEWILPVPAALFVVSAIAAVPLATGEDTDGFFLTFGLFAAILCGSAALIAAGVLVRRRSRKSAIILYAGLVVALIATAGTLAIRLQGRSGWGADEAFAYLAVAMAVFGPLVPLFGVLFRRIALKHAEAAAAQRMEQTGFQPAEVCANCSHPLLSDSSHCAECGAPNTR
jgi:uncharacterized membrane protein